METKLIIDVDEVEIVVIENEDGSTISMTKEHWDKLEAEREQSGTLS